MLIKAKRKKGDETQAMEFEYNLGSNLDEAIALFGKDVVFAQYIGGAKVAIRGPAWAKLDAGTPAAELTAAMADVKLGVRTRRAADPQAKLLSAWEKMAPEERKELLTKLRASQ